MKKGLFHFIIFLFSFNCAYSQCIEPATCTTTLTGTTDFNANETNAVICITGNYSGNLSLSNGATVIVENGATWTISTSFVFDQSSVFNNGTIDGNGAFVIGPSSVFVNSTTALLNVAGDLILNSNWPNDGDQLCPIENAGEINAYYVESVDTYVENSGTFNVTKEMFLHGGMSNSGQVNIVCPPGETNCSFIVGDFPDGQNYSNNGGVTTINGAAYFDGNIDGSGRFECTNPNQTVEFTNTGGYTGSDVFAVAGDFNISAPMGSNDGDTSNDPTLEVLGSIITPLDCLSGVDLVVNICDPFAPLSNTDICENYIQNTTTCANNFFVLPIDLIRFYFEENNNTIEFHWETENEINFSHFELEKSLDGNNFKHAQSITSTNKSSGDNYTSGAFNVSEAKGYYRLKLIDNNGAFEYSSILHYNGSKLEASFYPNPVGLDGAIHFSTETTAAFTVSILNVSGKVLKTENLSGKLQYSLDIMKGLRKGTYILILENEHYKKSQKLVY